MAKKLKYHYPISWQDIMRVNEEVAKLPSDKVLTFCYKCGAFKEKHKCF